MLNKKPIQKSVNVNDLKLDVVDSDNVIVTKKGHAQSVHVDEIVLPEYVAPLDEPLYTVHLSARFTTTPVRIKNNNVSDAQLKAIEQIDKFCEKLDVFANAKTAKGLPFSMHYNKAVAKTVMVKGCVENDVVTLQFTGFENIYKCMEVPYLDSHVSSTLFAFTVFNMYRQIKSVTSMMVRKFPSLVAGCEVKITRKLSPELLKMYITDDVRQKVKAQNPKMHEHMEANGLYLKIPPLKLYHFFGGMYDSSQYVSIVWEEVALGEFR